MPFHVAPHDDVLHVVAVVVYFPVLGTQEPISQLRGRWHDAYGARVMPTFHPAFLLRSPKHKRDVWEDMQRVRDYLAE